MLQYEVQLSIGLKDTDGHYIPRGAALPVIQAALAEQGLDGYTVADGTGYWKGVLEHCLLVSWVDDETITPDRREGYGETIARNIAIALRQECVLIVERPVEYRFVSATDVE